MDFQVLLSAMHLKDFKYINTLNITSNCIVINQCDYKESVLVHDEGREIKFISTTERGLSRSRNMAINNANSDICILCDNDVEYLPGYEKTILDEFNNNPKYDIIVFYIEKNKKNSKPYFSKKRRMGYYSTLKVFSPEIAFKRKSLLDNNVKFNNLFGAGSKYSMGEENIFLYDCLKKGLKILYVPKKIARLRDEDSTWFNGYNKKFFIDRGAIFSEMSTKFCLLLILQFAFRKRKLYKDKHSIRAAISYMLEGKKQYKNQ